MVGTWVFLALAFRQLVSSLINTAEFMVKFSGEYKRCLNTYLIIFRLFQLCTIVFIKFGYLIFGLHSKLSTNGWWLENRWLLGGCLIWTNKISVEKWWAYCLGYWLPLEIEKVERTGHAKDIFLCCAKDFTTSVTSFYICFYRVYHWFLCWIAKAAIRVASSWNSDGIENLTSSCRNKILLGVLKDLSFARKGNHIVSFLFYGSPWSLVGLVVVVSSSSWDRNNVQHLDRPIHRSWPL